ncbi:MAG TPA: DUF1684 domain-containing protein [Candidatus Polarisedimenticolia bacterium]|jgi:hypothetical protein|nr:DUF1684 domain-containing protein [Candidatus Polarisedimenticolia bacterium]
MMPRWKVVAGGAAVLLAGGLLLSAARPPGYAAEVEKWRQEREARLKNDTGWLTVAGLFWLKEGPNRFGTDPAADIILPAGTAPAYTGVFELKEGKTKVRVDSGATVTSAGRTVTEMELTPDKAGDPTVLALGDLSMFVIERGGKYAIRLKDKNSKMRREFTGLKWYPVKPEYRITATFNPYEPPKQIPVPNILGQTESLPSPGYVTFTLKGKTVRLEPVLESPDDKELFFIFRDGTSGDTTYPSGRFLYADMPVEGKVVLDFNKAYNPPCAFTPYATCPLPPPANRLKVNIEAGELNYGHHGGHNPGS